MYSVSVALEGYPVACSCLAAQADMSASQCRMLEIATNFGGHAQRDPSDRLFLHQICKSGSGCRVGKPICFPVR